jgi:hypothetical protein
VRAIRRTVADLKLKFHSALSAAGAQVDRQLILIVLFGLANGFLYSCLLPLWDGFDEPYHYGYVNSLSTGRGFPVLGKTTLSQEIEESFRLTPLPHVLSRAFPGSYSLDKWLALSETERSANRNALATLPRTLWRQPSEAQNYEAQQAALAYVVLAPVDWLLSAVPLTARILMLRLAISLASTFLLACASIALFQAMGLERWFRNLALFGLFATPMTWAAISHVGNDWLAIPLSTSFLAVLVTLVTRSGKQPATWLAILLSAGLLTKAYFLAFAPILVAALMREVMLRKLRPVTGLTIAAIPLAVAGPWYLRNLMLYGSASGTQESVAGVGMFRTVQAFPHINWIVSVARLARAGIWTGNWSYISFPRAPLNVLLIMASISLAILIAGRRKLASAERWVLITCGVFLVAMAYQLAAMWAFTNGTSAEAEPWYLQCIAPGFLSLVALGLQRGAKAGRLLARLLAITAAGISVFSYLGVLFPWYGGFRGRGAAQTFGWWLHGNPSVSLSNVAMVSAAWLFWLLVIFISLLVASTVTVLRVPVDQQLN